MINVFIKTYGCLANVADSQALANYLVGLGCSIVDKQDSADLIIINTCAIRDKAEQKVFSYLGCLSDLKKQKPYLKIGVIGCIATYRKKEFFKRFDHINFVFGAKENLAVLQEYLSDLVLKIETIKQIYSDDPDKKLNFGGQDRDMKITEKEEDKELILGGFKDKPSEFKQSFVNIMTGCDNYCSYCIVPFTRGREKSYPMSSIIERVQRDVQSGAKEINLLGQNVNSYKDPQTGAGFAELLKQVAQIDGEFWVRFVSPHPKDMTKDVLHVISEYNDKLCTFIHLPLQSGSNKILQIMNRTYDVEKYMEQISWIRDILPHATISTDIIVGFPGETEDDYLETRKVLEDIKFDLVFPFIYSSRKYTKAALMDDNCSKEEKTRRLEELRKRQIDICFARNSLKIGKTLKTLVEKRLTSGKLLARTEGNIRVLFDGKDDIIGKFVKLKIVDAGSVNLIGSLTK